MTELTIAVRAGLVIESLLMIGLPLCLIYAGAALTALTLG